MTSEPLVGSLIADRYRVVRRLGAGGMGTVYIALQEPFGREVALKVVRRELATDEIVLERFRREAMMLAQAQHPHIVTLLDFGEIPGGALYFAMEFVRGQTLRQRLRARGPIAPQKTIEIIKQCCAALSCAHAFGIIHRDLKPENILLMEAAGTPDFVKVVDFGVAKLVRGADDPGGNPEDQLTDHNSLVGTPGYIPAEVSLHGVTADPRSDLYALGVVWFEILTGMPPFRASTATALIMAHAVDPAPLLPDSVPLAITGLVSRLLAKDPNDRPSSADELLALLDQLPGLRAPGGEPAHLIADASAPTAGNTPRPPPRLSPTPAPARTLPQGSLPPDPVPVPVPVPVPDPVPDPVPVPSAPSAATGTLARARPGGAQLVTALAVALVAAGAVALAASWLRERTPTGTAVAPVLPMAPDAGSAVRVPLDAGVRAAWVEAGTARGDAWADVVDAGPSAAQTGKRPTRPATKQGKAGKTGKSGRSSTSAPEVVPDIYSP